MATAEPAGRAAPVQLDRGIAAFVLVILTWALKRYGPIVTDGVFQLIPFMTVLGAYLLFGERLTALQWVGGCILIGAAYALLIAKRQTHIRRITDAVPAS